ncbi:putative amine oxidase [copper-containing] [Mytilus californianus]|uniref:putative amine oxidase [copper-containing] n=1 Tax=Mytilus californianus TaxID=6549 RepID=UPI002246774E|nr:putative amine oxidase [copper-containing] [Mytilus californianus]
MDIDNHGLLKLVSTTSKDEEKRNIYRLPFCKRPSSQYGHIDTRESDHPSVFRDLTETEIKGLLGFLYAESSLNLTVSEKASVTSNYIFIADIYRPLKRDVLNHLDNGHPQPAREAQVMIFRGAIPNPDVIEIVVGTLPNPSAYKHVPYRPKSLPFIDRPFNVADNVGKVLKLIDRKLGDMLLEVYGGRLINCGNRCLIANYFNQVTSVVSGVKKRRFFWWVQHNVESSILRPLDFAFLVESELDNFSLPKVWFDGQLFKGLKDVLSYYNKYKHKIKKVPFPAANESSRRILISRGMPPFEKPLKDPQQVSPDGKRYNICDRHISYGFWEFDVANAAFRGPRLNDIRYKNERIAYEVSSQELALFYFGYKPFEYTAYYLDNSYQTGTLAKYLVPGVDCPLDATFLSSSYKVETQDKPLFNEHSFCVFEFNTGLPLRRQHAYFKDNHSFYEGVENIVLIIRTIPTVYPYEYSIDFIFYHNGVMKIKVTASGVVLGTWYGQDNPFSFQLDDNLMAPMHQHLYHFKVDLDIKGTKNRFETLDIETVVTPNEASDVPNATIVQNQFMKRLKKTEFEGAYKFDFNFPKYLTFVNNNVKDKFGNSAGYRLVNEGMIKNTRPPNDGNNPAASWSQYQVAVTKYKDSEPASSNMFAHSNNPVFDFQQFIDDNENIVDQDLVAWVTMGMYHIPQKEDLPATHTPGMSRSFHLRPFNYFDESPGMSVNNAVRIDAVEKKGKTESVRIRRYGVSSEVDCIPKKNPFENMLKENPCSIVEC